MKGGRKWSNSPLPSNRSWPLRNSCLPSCPPSRARAGMGSAATAKITRASISFRIIEPSLPHSPSLALTVQLADSCAGSGAVGQGTDPEQSRSGRRVTSVASSAAGRARPVGHVAHGGDAHLGCGLALRCDRVFLLLLAPILPGAPEHEREAYDETQ